MNGVLVNACEIVTAFTTILLEDLNVLIFQMSVTVANILFVDILSNSVNRRIYIRFIENFVGAILLKYLRKIYEFVQRALEAIGHIFV